MSRITPTHHRERLLCLCEIMARVGDETHTPPGPVVRDELVALMRPASAIRWADLALRELLAIGHLSLTPDGYAITPAGRSAASRIMGAEPWRTLSWRMVQALTADAVAA